MLFKPQEQPNRYFIIFRIDFVKNKISISSKVFKLYKN